MTAGVFFRAIQIAKGYMRFQVCVRSASYGTACCIYGNRIAEPLQALERQSGLECALVDYGLDAAPTRLNHFGCVVAIDMALLAEVALSRSPEMSESEANAHS